MESQKRIDVLEDIKTDVSKHFTRICQHHKVDEATLYNAEKNIQSFFDWIIAFYKEDIQDNKTGKKALMLGMVNTISSLDVPIMTNQMHQSPIESLLYSTLQISMPARIFEKAFLMPQVSVCDNKYFLDIALMERRDPKKDGTDGVAIIGIECDGYNYHYEDPDKAAKTLKRIRDISMDTGIRILTYTGKEIYKDCMKLAEDFWRYVEKTVYPIQSDT